MLLLAIVALVFLFSDEFLRSIRDLMNFLTTTAIPITAITTMNVSAGPVVGSDPSSLVTGTAAGSGVGAGSFVTSSTTGAGSDGCSTGSAVASGSF